MWNVFDNFILKKWSCAIHVVNSSKKLVENLDKDQNWSMSIYKGCEITLIKIRDEKVILQNVRDVLNDFP